MPSAEHPTRGRWRLQRRVTIEIEPLTVIPWLANKWDRDNAAATLLDRNADPADILAAQVYLAAVGYELHRSRRLVDLAERLTAGSAHKVSQTVWLIIGAVAVPAWILFLLWAGLRIFGRVFG